MSPSGGARAHTEVLMEREQGQVRGQGGRFDYGPVHTGNIALVIRYGQADARHGITARFALMIMLCHATVRT